MKLLFISGDTALAQGKKGPFYYLLEEFSKYWDRIDVICSKTKPKINNVHGNVFIHGFPWLMRRQPWFVLKKGIELYKKEKFDIFGIHNYPPFYNDIGGYWLSKKIKTPYVLEVMHINGYPKAGNFKEWVYKILERLFVNFFAKKAKAVRVVNQKQVPEFLMRAGVDRKKIKYVPAFYIDLDVFKSQNLEKKYDLVFSGRLVKNKGIFLLLKAIKKIKNEKQKIKNTDKKFKNIRLIIIGSGPLEAKIKKYIKKNRLEKNIFFSGWLPGIEDVAGVYNQSKIMVMPSFNEGGPRVTLEAMNCKVPVITSRVGIMLDIIKHNYNGLFIDWDVEDIVEKIRILLGNEDLRKKIAEAGYNTAQQFEKKKAIKNYAETYKNLLHSS